MPKQLHNFKAGDIVNYFRPRPGRTEKYRAEIIKAPPEKMRVTIRYWPQGQVTEASVLANSLETLAPSQTYVAAG